MNKQNVVELILTITFYADSYSFALSIILSLTHNIYKGYVNMS